MRLPRSESRLLLLILAVALVLRLAAVGVALWMDVRPVNDEWGYRDRGAGWAEIWRDLAAGRAPAAEHWDRAYEDGFQPPLFPMALGAVGALGGPVDLGGRLLNALLTALAAPLVFRLARRSVDRPAALAAVALHLLYPGFAFFAHSLWAEPLFVLLLLAAAERALAAREVEGGRRLGRAAAAGACAGLACLTRTAGLAYLVVLPLVFLGTGRGWAGRRRAAVLMVAAALAVIAPWQAALQREEGRVVLLATSSGLNLAMGNNPYVAEGAGSTWTDPTANARLRADIAHHAERRGLSPDRAAASYAYERLHADPAEAVRRAGDRLRLVATPDLFPVRHLLQVVCRPVPLGVAALHWVWHVLAWLGLSYLILRGLLAGTGGARTGALAALAALAAAGFVGPALTVGFSRLHLPILALLLPVAGAAWARRREGVPPLRRAYLAGAMGLMTWLTLTGLDPVIERQLWPSAHYKPLVDRAAALVGAEPTYTDQVVVRLDDDGPERLDLAPNPRRRASVSRTGRRTYTAHVFADPPGEAGRLGISTPDGREIAVDPVSRAHAWRWRDLAPEGLRGVRIRWQGGVSRAPSEPPAQ